ncbi:hypothetical protein ACK305_14370 [Aeromonas caviae]
MKVLQTLGVHGPTQQAGIFQYKRTSTGVHIDTTVGQAADAGTMDIPADNWGQMIDAISERKGVHSLQDLKGIISEQLGVDGTGAAAVAAILEHEGSVDHYGGVVGQGERVSINLRVDD